jgi:hypothetical protein
MASGAGRCGTQGRYDGESGRIRPDEAGVVVRWRLQRVRALVVPPQGTGEEPRLKLRRMASRRMAPFQGTRKKRKVWGEEKRGRKRRDPIPLLVRRGGREVDGVVAHEPDLGVSDHPRLQSQGGLRRNFLDAAALAQTRG